MTDPDQGRRCGSCGAAVDSSAETCPTCGALLAAYEAPSGSASGPAEAVPSAFDPIAADEPDVAAMAPLPPLHDSPEVTSFDAAAALEESRRTLGMTPASPVLEEASPPATAVIEPEPVPVQVPSSEEPAPALPSPVVGRTTPEVVAPAPEPPERARAARQDIPREPAPTPRTMAGGGPKQPWSPTVPPSEPLPSLRVGNATVSAYQLGRIAVVVMVAIFAIWILASLGFRSIFTLAIVVMVLVNMIKGTAKKSGRKSTTMPGPDPHGRNRR